VIQRFAAETILTDVKVLAIDQQIARGKDGAAIPGKNATLEVTPKQAELVTAVGLLGNLQLVLRGLPGDQQEANAQPASETGFTSDTDASKALKALVGGKSPTAAKTQNGFVIHINRAGQISAEGGPK
jgi:pilus assembly protein CpaB